MPDEIRELDCREAVRQLWDYLDNELDDQRMAEVRRHLEECGRCLPHAEFGRRFLEALNSHRYKRMVPVEVRDQVMSALVAAGFGED